MQSDPKPNTEHSNPANWYLGCIYYAPNDPDVVVPKRWGPAFGGTVNFARREAYLIAAIPLIISAIIFACVFLNL